MAKRLQLRTGTTTQHNTFTGALGEVSVDTDKDVLVVHDGTTAGGFPVSARANNDGSISFIAKDGTVRATINTANKLSASRVTATKSGLTPNDVSFHGSDMGTGIDVAGNTQVDTVVGGVVVQRFNAVSAVRQSITTPFSVGGANPLYPDFSVRAWVNFNGTNGAIRAQGNVSSVVRNGVGTYTVTFSTALPDANYSISGFANFSGTGANQNAGLLTQDATYSPTASSFVVKTGTSTTGNLYDGSFVNITITR